MWSSELEDSLRLYGNLETRHHGAVHRQVYFKPARRLSPCTDRPTPHLPAEVLSMIINLSLPPEETLYADRYEQLRSCSLVARQWARVAQPELFRHIHLDNSKSAMMFLKLAEGDRGRVFARLAVSLWIKESVGDNKLQGKEESVLHLPDSRSITFFMLRACVNLTRLRLSGVPIEPSVLSLGVGIRSLFLEQCFVTLFRHNSESKADFWHLPNLHQLHVSATSGFTEVIDATINPLFTRISFPKLKVLSYGAEDNRKWESPTFPSLGESLEVLHFIRPQIDDNNHWDHFSALPSDLTTRCTKLRELCIRLRDRDDLEPFAKVLANSRQLVTLRLEETRGSSDLEFHLIEPDIIRLLQQANLPNLRFLSLPTANRPVDEEARTLTQEVCSRMEVELFEEDWGVYWQKRTEVKDWTRCLGEREGGENESIGPAETL